jgi:hypothetical protein
MLLYGLEIVRLPIRGRIHPRMLVCQLLSYFEARGGRLVRNLKTMREMDCRSSSEEVEVEKVWIEKETLK